MGLIERTRSLRRKPSNPARACGDDDLDCSNTETERRDIGPMEIIRSVGYDVHDSPNPFRPCAPATRPMTGNRAADTSRELSIPGPTIEFATDDQIFRFPTPSPRLPSMQTNPMPQHDSTNIGIALGSPRMQPIQNNVRHMYHSELERPDSASRSYQSSHLTQVITPPNGREASPPRQQQLKKAKSSTWKSIFGRKPSRPVVPERSKTHQPPVPVKDYSRPKTPEKRPAVNHSRQYSTSRGFERHNMRAEMDKVFLEQTMQSPMHMKEIPKTPKVARKTPEPPVSPITNGSQSSQDFFDALPRQNSRPLPEESGSQSLLDVVIPKHEMERYSIMFEGLLKPNKPSLLERRHGTLRRLRPMGEDGSNTHLIVEHDRSRPQRRATSPSMPSRPSPSQLDGNGYAAQRADLEGSIFRPGALQRSQTAPVRAFSPSTQRLRVAALTAGPSTAETSPVWSETSLPPTPTWADVQPIFTFGEEQVVGSQKHVQSMPKISNATWDLPRSRFAPEPADSLHQSQRTPETTVPAKAQDVTTSVARQVSFSRARKPMQKAIVVKQSLRPTFVDTPNRKSTMVMIEHA